MGQPDVEYAYYYEESNYNTGFPFEVEDIPLDWDLHFPAEPSPELRESFDPLNDTIRHEKRDTGFSVSRNTPYWAQSQVSLAKGSAWLSPESKSYFPEASNGDKYRYTYDSASAKDTYVYMLYEDGIWNSHSVRSPSLICSGLFCQAN